MIPDLVIRGARVVTADGVGPAAIHIRGGIISAIAEPNELPQGCPVFDVGNSVVMPGLVDTHVHVNEPGRTDWEGFHSATRAAAAGGVTTLVDMPLNSIPATTTPEALHAKLAAAQGHCWVDVGFWGGVVPGNAPQLRPLFDAGVLGFKCFLIPSGVDEFRHVAEADLRVAVAELAAVGAVLIFHAELPEPVEKALSAQRNGDPRSYSTFLASRPREAENDAIALIVRLSRGLRARVHVVHHSSADALPILRRAHADRLPLTVETCPHYLCFAAEEIPDGATQFKCCPPIRERENREQLWAALGEGLIEMVVSDHSPCPPELKMTSSGDFLKAWGGISSLELRLPAMWTAARRRGFSLEKLAEWLCRAPARLVGLERRKGAIERGVDADLVVWNPEASFRVEPAKLHHRHKLTPYAGQELNGVVEATFLRGEMIYDHGRFPASPVGTMLLRGAC
ncbi:MAG TPA: allantoinase AllB [Candidatus Acidoferrales bacterium]|nr:allantoinase AllB [Candidatus Acidoferrales bacterium]